MSENLNEQLDKDLSTCRWFSIQCDESVDSSSTAQLMVFIRMVFDDLSTKEELLTLIPLRTTTRGVDIYNAIKTFFVEKKVPLEKLVSVTTDGAPAMAICAKVTGFDHVMTPVVKIINSIRAKAKQHRTFKVLLEELSAEYGDLLLHTEIRWLSRGRILKRFLALLGEIKEFMQSREEDTSLLDNTEWLLDLAFLTDVTEKLNNLNCELQGTAPSTARAGLARASDSLDSYSTWPAFPHILICKTEGQAKWWMPMASTLYGELTRGNWLGGIHL
ncbi:hypothetical protein SKAU_G00236200 [Synaphobranchus kaupii]|uniref:Uncharacterized protein n=1 Tax=Synaphobranchus kaupii TaxID=118154 RepID=A0A9Q1F6N4_SYNKA|nr:hypothetical protein SKAU_G00236200 [Synaphobranchus kaupii]